MKKVQKLGSQSRDRRIPVKLLIERTIANNFLPFAAEVANTSNYAR